MFTPNAFAKHKNVNEDEGMRTCVTKYKIKYKQGNLFRLKTNGERSFRYAAARIWNGLPQHMRSINTVYSFKNSLKTYLFKLHHDYMFGYYLHYD